MYENLIGQEEIVRILRGDLSRNELPPSLLFAGPENAGKLTAALETARALSCETGDAAWNCPCPSCARHRTLAHPDLLLMGPRSFRAEIKAAGETLERLPNRAARFLFYRAVRKLTRRFDPALFYGEEARLAKAVPLLQNLEELAELAGPDADETAQAPGEAARAAAKALPVADKLEALLPDALPIFQVRAAERWARLAPYGRMKVVVIENAERMLDGARNALLKILEEPPATSRFLLLSSRPSSLMPTILSRVRAYTFRPRDAGASGEILAKVFRASPEDRNRSLDEYLAARKPLPESATDEYAFRFLSAVCYQASREGVFIPDPLLDLSSDAPDPSVHRALAEISAATKGFGAGDDSLSYLFSAFLKSLARLVRSKAAASDARTDAVLAGWAAAIRDAQLRYETYNLPPAALAERLAEALALPLRTIP
ncbi:MAG: DNA polymerase III [Treponema sp.]|nr:DNA polymerase III [Treponema sp.]